jgi:hypothetical protein
MAMTGDDILRNADAFRAAYPSWPHAEPEPLRPPGMSLAEQRARRRAVVLGQARAHAAAKGITADSPTLLDPDAELAYAQEQADYDGGEG